MTAAVARNIQLVAWVVLLGAFALCATLAVGLPWSAAYYARTATVEQKAVVECKSGSCALARPPAVARVVRPGDTLPPVPEGFTVATDATARAFVRFFDGSTVNLETDTGVALRRMRRPRFGAGDRVGQIEVVANLPAPGATARLTAGTTWAGVSYVIDTPYARVHLAPESHVRLELDVARLRVSGLEGKVTVENAAGSTDLGPDQYTLVGAGAAPAAPSSGPENIVANADFDRPIDDGSWAFRLVVPGENHTADPGRSFAAVLDDGRTVVRIVRQGSGGRPADMVYTQGLGKYDVSAASTISVRARVRVLAQSLPGGGMRGTEMPVMIKLVGETPDGDQIAWTVGFYAVRPDPQDPKSGNVLSSDVVNVEVPLGAWYAYDSGNLLDTTNDQGFDRHGWPAPARLTRIEIIASGHDYASDIDAVEVWVR